MKAARYAFASSEGGSRSIEHGLPPIRRQKQRKRWPPMIITLDVSNASVEHWAGHDSFGFVTWVKPKVTDAFGDNDDVSV
ncbi:MAG: hypothetical protein ACTS46_01755 [Candidatus Hodgkinia cicadicola]